MKVYIDGANPEVVSDLKFRYNERTDYLAEIAYYEKHHLNWQLNMRVLSSQFLPREPTASKPPEDDSREWHVEC